MNLNLGLIGLGYWGPNYVRTLGGISGCTITWCSDLDESNFGFLSNMNIKTTNDYKEMLDDQTLDAVIVSTPTSTHYDIVRDVLESGKHVLVEKPITTSHKEAEELVGLAKEKGLVLMVGHTFLFNAGIRKVKELIDSDAIGGIVYMHSQRTGLGPIRNDVNVLWDLAPHDISIFLHILGMPKRVIAKGRSFIKNNREDVVFLMMEFENGVIANAHVSWTDPYKIRSLTVVGSKKMVVFDDVSNEHVKVFDKGINYEAGDSYGEFKDIVRDGDVTIPKIGSKAPLRAECEHFMDCIKNSKQPLSGGTDGMNVVKVLEAATKSLETGGWVQLS
jgi:predicted dehydrogenase